MPPGPPEDPWGPYIREAAKRFDVPEIWIRSVMRVESGGNEYLNGQLITSSAGAMGLMQVMPETYEELRDRYSLGDDPFDPHDNILAGAAYMREMYDIYGSPGFLAAYNAGPRRLDDYLSNNRPLPDETRRYVAMIGPDIVGVYPNSRSPAEDYAMNALPIEHSAGHPAMAARCSLPATAAAAGGCRRADRFRSRNCPSRRAAAPAAARSSTRWCTAAATAAAWRVPDGLAGGGRTGADASWRFARRAVGNPGRRLFQREAWRTPLLAPHANAHERAGSRAHRRCPACTRTCGCCTARG